PLSLYYLHLPLIPPPPRSTLFPYTTLFRSTMSSGRRERRISTACRTLSASGEFVEPKFENEIIATRGSRLNRRAVSAVSIAVSADRKSTRLNSSHLGISYAVFCLKKKKKKI